jgi:hypothetical protein
MPRLVSPSVISTTDVNAPGFEAIC